MKIAFRTDSSIEIGSGHLLRCLTLAKYLQDLGHECIFISRTLPGNLLSLLKNDFKLIELKHFNNLIHNKEIQHGHWLMHDWPDDASETIKIVRDNSIDYLFVDHYALDENWEKEIFSNVKKLIVIDDLADRRHRCHYLVDMNYGSESNYNKIVNSDAQLLCGNQYAVIRKEFLQFPQNNPRKKLSNILLFFGGVDKDNFAGQFIESGLLREFSQINFHLLTRQESFIHLEQDFSNLNVHYNSTNVPQLMQHCDLFIGSGGTITFERFYMGLPGFIQCVAINQNISNKTLFEKNINIPIELKIEKELLSLKLQELIVNPSWLTKNSNELFQLVDGKGHERLLQSIFSN